MDRTRRLSEIILERYPGTFNADYEENKKKLDELAVISSKQLRNHIAGYITRRLRVEMPAESATEKPKAE